MSDWADAGACAETLPSRAVAAYWAARRHAWQGENPVELGRHADRCMARDA